jgi:predicted phage terminase large subunit-like protein
MPFDQANSAEFLSHRVEVERELGKRDFYQFYKMAWPIMDPAAFQEGKHIRVIAYHLQLAARREIQQLLICIPPRYSKSLLCSVAFPAWVWTWWPAAKFITCSYDQKLATRDSLATRRLIEHPWYRARWPEVMLERDQNQKMWYHTTAGGVRYVGSPNTGVTGHGSDFNSFDDPHNIIQGESDAERQTAVTFWFESMSSRFNDPKRGVSLVIQQRVHAKDVAAECINRGYHTVVLPARFEHNHPQRNPYDWRRVDGEPLWEEKFPSEVLDRLWTALRDYAVAGQQQQRPTAREGGLFKRNWFEIVDTLPEGVTWVRAWDFAGTKKAMKNDPDWTVGCKIGIHALSGVVYIAHVLRDRCDPAGVQKMVKTTAEQDGKDVRIFIPQDPAQAGKFQLHIYTTQVVPGYSLHSEVMTERKTDRADPLAAQAKVGNVKLYRAIWNDTFLDEMTAFPSGAHDDQVDAAASGYTMLMDPTTGLLDFMRSEAERRRQEENERRKAMGLPAIIPLPSPSSLR